MSQTKLLSSIARRFLAETNGSAANEYAVLLALLVIISIGAIAPIGGFSMGIFSSASSDASRATGQSGGALGPVITTQYVSQP